MKVLFLDIDGVLNHFGTKETFTDATGKYTGIDPRNVKPLNKVVEQHPDIKIVVSSAWRVTVPLAEIQAALVKAGFIGQLHDCTPNLDTLRDQEIRTWLNSNPGYTNIVILDDHPEFIPTLRGVVVQTPVSKGLLHKHLNRINKTLAITKTGF